MAGPISISKNGKSIATTSKQELIFNTEYPFHKLDSTNIHSFQIISIFFGSEPPAPASPPSGHTTSRTLVYSYAHGYDYVPSTWFIVSNDNFVANTLGNEGSLLISQSAIYGATAAYLNIEVDSTNVYFYVDKYWYAFDPSPPHIIGTTVYVRANIFAEDLSGTSLPANA